MSDIKRRRAYARIYICVSEDHNRALREKDGLLSGYTDASDAEKASAKTSFIVSSFTFFRERFGFSRLNPAPEAMRIHAKGYGQTKGTYIAQIDATAEELGTLNEMMPSDVSRHPRQVAAQLAAAKLRPE